MVAVDEAAVQVCEVVATGVRTCARIPGSGVQLGMTDGGGKESDSRVFLALRRTMACFLFPFCFYRFITRRNMIPLSHRRHKLFPFLSVYLRFLLQVSFYLFQLYRAVFISYVMGEVVGVWDGAPLCR